ncbi:carboxypeptidase-like regulatory domain-containing protein [Microcoleus sp. T2B6]|uniref:carboxypeptidase-like regulatory domain-containing protein n=1 Tax=Microcoleus sp. T2B6 TaxID=3055424 RepID=UPI002FD05639
MLSLILSLTPPILFQKSEAINTVKQLEKFSNSQQQPATFNSNNSLLVQGNAPSNEVKILPETLLVGVVIRGKEVGNLEVLRNENTFLIPLDDFAKLTGITVKISANGSIEISTPLGTTKLEPSDYQTINGLIYLTDTLIAEKLATPIEFDASEVALMIDLPWQPNARSASQQTELKAEVRPPQTSFSTVRENLDFSQNGNSSSLLSSTVLGGRLWGGSWRIRADNNFQDQQTLTEYFWYKREGEVRYQVGRQQIGLHPLLSNLDMTGAQIAYTNLPSGRFYDTSQGTELLPRRAAPLRTFRGQAPPGSFVQLRVDGTVVAQQQVGLNGEYQFLNVNLSATVNEIDFLIYNRNNFNSPAEIRQLRIGTSDLLLPAGRFVHLAGAGVSGNLFDKLNIGRVNSEPASQPTAFYQFRQGLSDNFTVETGVQNAPDSRNEGGSRLQAEAGFIWQVANPLTLAASVGTSKGKTAYTSELQAQLPSWQFFATSQFFPASYLSSNQERSRFDHSANLSYRVSDRLTLGLIARSRQDETNSAQYLAPVFNWRPMQSLYLSGKPDLDGRYVLDAFYQLNNAVRLSANVTGDRRLVDVAYSLSLQDQLSLSAEFGGNLSTRYRAIYSYTPFSLNRLSYRLGVVTDETGAVRPIIGASLPVFSGVLLRAEYQGLPGRSSFQSFNDQQLIVSLVAGFTVDQGRFIPAQNSAIGQNRGQITGRIQIEGGSNLPGLKLEGVEIEVSRDNLLTRTKTDSQGNFLIGNLPEGVYLVELDPEQLPFALVPVKTTYTAEVAAGAITSLYFTVRPEFGLAGRVLDANGKSVAGIKVELLNATGEVIKTTATDQFGLYRIDGVPIGRYTLRIAPQNLPDSSLSLPTRTLEIRDDFLFDQDLQLPNSGGGSSIRNQ